MMIYLRGGKCEHFLDPSRFERIHCLDSEEQVNMKDGEVELKRDSLLWCVGLLNRFQALSCMNHWSTDLHQSYLSTWGLIKENVLANNKPSLRFVLCDPLTSFIPNFASRAAAATYKYNEYNPSLLDVKADA